MDREHALHQAAALLASRQFAASAAAYRALIAADPNDAEAFSNLGAVLNAAQDHQGAERACRAALAIAPAYWAALANLATALHRQFRYPEALALYNAAVRANPRNPSAWTNFAVALQEMGEPEAALPLHQAALALAPKDAELHTNRAITLLAAGRLAEGFAAFDWRWRTRPMQAGYLPGPQWSGDAPANKRILVYAEGGFGDTLQFVRFVPLLAATGARVTLRAQAPLLRLLRRNLPEGVSLIAEDAPLPAYDAQCPLLSLPRFFPLQPESLPAAPYLRPCPDKSARWRAILAQACGKAPRIGLVWSGATRLGMAEMRAMDQRRSLHPAQLAPLAGLSPRLAFVSLQCAPAEPMPPAILPLFDPMGQVEDFDDTAAIAANLDLIVAVDTAVAHLAGALGRPVWLLSRYDACWRWQAHRTDSPWYKSLRLFRQPSPGDWSHVLHQLTHALKKDALPRAA